jgi:transcriptional regulator with GAF, ATPase, and Fis domain
MVPSEMSESLQPTPSGSGDVPGADPARVFASLAQVVYTPGGMDDVFAQLCQAAPLVVPGCDHASLMLRKPGRHAGRFFTAAASDETARRIDAAEIELGDGPCMDAILEEAAQVEDDLTRHGQWPRLAEWILAHTPVRGAVGYRLIVGEEKVGALNLFSDTPGAFTENAVNQAAVFAAFASVAVNAAIHNERAETLQAGLESNREIGKAVGLLMAFHKIGDAEAFQMLRKTSQDLNLKLAEVAQQILDHHRAR